MKQFVTFSLGFAIGAQALVARQEALSICCFHMSASGGKSGDVLQAPDGPNQIGGNFPQGQYCIHEGGRLREISDRGCVLTNPTSQFQCKKGTEPTEGFEVACDGTVSSFGNRRFYACATGYMGSYNVYTRTVDSSCVEITLTADGCRPSCSTQSPPPPQNSPPPPPPPASPVNSPPSQNNCPTDLQGPFEFPHLIVPVDSAAPDKAYGTSYEGQITPQISSIFNFDILPSDGGKKCSLIFLFPPKSELRSSDFTFSGGGAIEFSQLSGNADSGTTYDNAPSEKTSYGTTTVAPGNSYSIATFDCPAGQRITYKLKSAADTSLKWFQDFNPAPIGLYIRVC